MYAKSPEIVYFMECSDFIKIGVNTKRRASERLNTLQCGNPLPIRPLGFLEGGRSMERNLLLSFAPDLMAYIERAAAPWTF